MRHFAGLDLQDDRLPDESTICKFRHLLERHGLTEQFFAQVQQVLQERGLQLSKGTMVDATLIAASPSTKNKAARRDPEMRQTKKGNQWYFGMKVHVGADVDCGAAHSVVVTAANEADISQLPQLVRPSDQVIFADAGYASDSYKRGSRALGIRWCVSDKRRAGRSYLVAHKKSATASTPKCEPAWSICFASSSASLAGARSATRAWPRTGRR